jgi:hypothetical protein
LSSSIDGRNRFKANLKRPVFFPFYSAHLPQKQITPFVSDQESNIERQWSLCTLAEQVREEEYSGNRLIVTNQWARPHK